MEPDLPRSPLVSSPHLALLLSVVTLALFLTVGTTAQVLNLGWGLWFTEIFIFLGTPWVAVRLSGRSPVRYTGLEFPGWKPIGFGFLLGAVNFFAWVIPLQWLSRWLAPAWMEELFDASKIFENQTPIELAAIISGAGIAAPLCEEFFFRGVLQQGLQRLVRPRGAITLTALFFSALHLDPIGFLARFELGLLFGVLFLRSGSIWPGVMAHAANNLVSTALFFAFRGAEAEEPKLIQILPMAALGLAAFAGVASLAARSPWILVSPRPAAEVLPRPSTPWRIIGPWAAAAIVLVIGLLAVDSRGVRLNLVDARIKVREPKPTAPAEQREAYESLLELRRKARAGKVPIEEYVERRRALEEAAGTAAPDVTGTDTGARGGADRPSTR